MYTRRPASFAPLDTARARAIPNAPRGGYPPPDLDADCPWRVWQPTCRKNAAVSIGTWVLLGLLAFLVSRVLMTR